MRTPSQLRPRSPPSRPGASGCLQSLPLPRVSTLPSSLPCTFVLLAPAVAPLGQPLVTMVGAERAWPALATDPSLTLETRPFSWSPRVPRDETMGRGGEVVQQPPRPADRASRFNFRESGGAVAVMLENGPGTRRGVCPRSPWRPGLSCVSPPGEGSIFRGGGWLTRARFTARASALRSRAWPI